MSIACESARHYQCEKVNIELVIPVIIAWQCDDHPFHSIDFEWRIDWSTLNVEFGQIWLVT